MSNGYKVGTKHNDTPYENSQLQQTHRLLIHIMDSFDTIRERALEVDKNDEKLIEVNNKLSAIAGQVDGLVGL